MRFNIKLIIPVFVLLVASTGCKKSYLQTTPYDGIDLSIAITTEADLKAADIGMYNAMRSYLAFGRYLPAKGDIMADNTYCSSTNTGRENTTYNVYSFTPSTAVAGSVFNQLYIVIKRANQIIAATVPASATVNQYKGEAYAARALSYLELVRNYAYPYSSGANNPGVSLVTEFFKADIKPARNTVGEVYTQILADLNQAYSLMTVYTSSAYFSKYAARALQARVYMDMADWANAKTAALDVVTNGGFTTVASTSYVAWWAAQNAASANKQEAIFSLICDATGNNGNESLSYLYYQAGSYGDYVVTNSLYNLYSATDVRRNFIVKVKRGQDSTWSSVKYPNSLSSNKDNIPVLRYSETLLILAEAYYNTTDPTNALLYANMVAQKRDPSFTGYTSSGAQILEDILTEKRKELAFEGERYWDLYRLKRSFTKVVDQPQGTTLSIVLPTTRGSRFPIPQAETDTNPNTSQNSEYQ